MKLKTKTWFCKENEMREEIEILYNKGMNEKEIKEKTGYPLSYIQICIKDIQNNKAVFVK